MNAIRYYAEDDKLSWEQPDWCKKVPLTTTSVGIAVKAGESLAKEITKLLEHANEQCIRWERPSWVTDGPKLRATGNAHVMKTKGNLAKPITKLPHLPKAASTVPDDHLQKSIEHNSVHGTKKNNETSITQAVIKAKGNTPISPNNKRNAKNQKTVKQENASRTNNNIDQSEKSRSAKTGSLHPVGARAKPNSRQIPVNLKQTLPIASTSLAHSITEAGSPKAHAVTPSISTCTKTAEVEAPGQTRKVVGESKVQETPLKEASTLEVPAKQKPVSKVRTSSDDHSSGLASANKEQMLIELLEFKKAKLSHLQASQKRRAAAAPVSNEVTKIATLPVSSPLRTASAAETPVSRSTNDTPQQSVTAQAHTVRDGQANTPYPPTPDPLLLSPTPVPASIQGSASCALVVSHVPQISLSLTEAARSSTHTPATPVSSSIQPSLSSGVELSEPNSPPAVSATDRQATPAQVPGPIPPRPSAAHSESKPTQDTVREPEMATSASNPVVLENHASANRRQDRHKSTISKMFKKFKPSFMKHSKRPRRAKRQLGHQHHGDNQPIIMATVMEIESDEDEDQKPTASDPALPIAPVAPTVIDASVNVSEYDEQTLYEEQTIYDEETLYDDYEEQTYYDEQTISEYEDVTYISECLEEDSEFLYEEVTCFDDDVEDLVNTVGPSHKEKQTFFLEGISNIVASSCNNEEEFEA